MSRMERSLLLNKQWDMRKKYIKPKITVEAMALPLLLDTSNIHVGGTGTFDAKGFSSYYYDDFYDDEEE